jgi:TPR repeat protein
VESVGPYRILGELGRGGAGAVYRAQDPRTGEQVAVKVLLRGRGATAAQLRRFGRESRALLKVEDPHVVRLREVGEHRGSPYLVLDYHPGGSLAERLREGPLSPADATRLGTEVAAGVEAAHAAGVLHRDLKPANVLLDDQGGARLTDFGLAKDLGRIEETQQLSRTGEFLGTPGYWAPEQAAGQVSSLGPAVDVYGLGAVLYAALTGRPPIVGANLIEVVTATATQPPPALRSLRPDVPRPLAAVVMRCLEKDPGDRWESAAAVGEALAATLREGSARATRARLLAPLALVLVAAPLAWGVALREAEPPPGRLHEGAPERASGPAEEGGREDARTAELGDARTADPGDARSVGPGDAPPAEPSGAELYAEALALRGGSAPAPAVQQLLRRAAEAGHPPAMTELGVRLTKGEGMPRDDVEAALWYRRAAEAGHLGGMHQLGYVLRRGQGVERDLPEAARWFRRAAEEGDVGSMYYYGEMLWQGQGGPPDPAGAVRWFSLAAEGDHVYAMLNLASALLRGQGTAPDATAAAGWLRRAAEQGEPLGMFHLATLLEQGVGGPKNDREAATWYRRAAELGHPAAMLNLAIMLAEGQGVPPDVEEAKAWLRKAQAAGDPQVQASASAALAALGG